MVLDSKKGLKSKSLKVQNMLRIFATINIVFFISCSSYFTKSEHLNAPPQLISQNSRVVLLSSKDDKLKIIARMTYLNPIDSSVFYNREYFFLEIFNDDENVIVPDSMQLSMFGKKPLWFRKVDNNEYDDVIMLENNLSSGYLIAFRQAGAFEQKRIKVDMKISNFSTATFDFSYAVLKTHL